MSKLHLNTTDITAAQTADPHKKALTIRAALLASTALIAGVALHAPGAMAGGSYTVGGLGPFPIASAVDPGIISGFTAIPATLDLTSAQNSRLTFNTFNVSGAGPNVVNLNGNDVNSTLQGVWLWTTTSDVVVNADAAITSVGNSIEMINTTTGSLIADGMGVGTLTSTAADGVLSLSGFAFTTGGTTVKNFASINGAIDGINATAANGNVSITNNALIKGQDDGIEAYALGAGKMLIQNNGTISGGPLAGSAGVYSRAGTGTTLIDNNGPITGNSWAGIDAESAGGGIAITNNASITSTGVGGASNITDGVFASALGGNVLINANGPITGADDGIEAYTAGTGTMTVTNNGNIIGTNGIAGSAGVYTRTVNGATNISNNGNITGPSWSGIDAETVLGNGSIAINGNGNITGGTFDGITALTAGGTIDIGTTATNGVILGLRDGIGAAAGSGPINIKVDKNVTGTTHDGISASNLLGQSGNVKIDILKPTTVVSGGTAGISIATLGTGTINNAGIIKQIGDTGAANTTGGYAIVSSFGNNTVNNQAGGQIIGSIFSVNSPGNFVLNNQAGGTWTPGTGPLDTNVFGQASDKVNNSGLINIRTGITGFASGPLDNVLLENKSGGVINMRYGDGVSPLAATAKDSLYVNTFKADAGSTLKVNVDFTQAHNTGTEQTIGGGVFNDRSTNNGGFGTADTIVTTSAANPGTTSKIDLKTLGGAKVGSSGSIAIIDTAATGFAGIADPGLGGLPALLAKTSKHYVLVNDPSTGAVKYALIEDSLGGVSLVWAPNITASSLGGFGGATGVGTPGGPSSGAAIASASAASNGVGGLGNSGGPSGGGAAGHVADMAAGSALQSDDIADPRQGSLKDGGGAVAAAECTRARAAWVQGEASRSNYDGGGDGRSESLSGGVETGLGSIEGRGCNRVAVGVFGVTGTSDTSWQTGRSNTDNDGVGGYVRASSASGLYGSVLGSWTWANSDLTNNVFGSKAKQDSDGFTGVATLGHVSRIGEKSAIDLRAFVAYGNIDGGGFTDTQGITVSGSHNDLVTVGGSVGLYTALTDTVQGFVRGGVKWSQVDSSMTAFGITANGNADEASGSVEAGFVARASEAVELGASGFGEFSDSTTGYGGRAHFNVKF